MALRSALVAVRPAVAEPCWLIAAGSLALVALVATVVLIGVALVRIATNAYGATGDFLSFYAAGKIIASGHGAQLYDAATQAWVQRASYPAGAFDEAIGYPLPVFAAWMFAPLSRLPFTTAFFLWMTINIGLLGWLVRQLAGHLAGTPRLPRLLFLCFFAFSISSVTCVIFGQVDLIVFSGLLIGYTLLREDRQQPAGAALALALFKPHLLVGVVLMLLVWRQWKTLAMLGAVGVPLLLVPALVTGPGLLFDNLAFAATYPGSDVRLEVNAEAMANWRGFVVSATGSTSVWLWLPGMIAIGVVAVTACVSHWRRSALGAANADQAFALAVLLPLLVSPHLHTQSLVLLFIPGGIALRGYLREDVLAEDADARERTAMTVILAAFAAMFFVWIATAAGVALLVFFVLGCFWLCLARWPNAQTAMAEERLSVAELRLTALEGRRYDPSGRRA